MEMCEELQHRLEFAGTKKGFTGNPAKPLLKYGAEAT